MECLVREGLRPHHVVVDIGCGCLRAGIHLVRYLEPGNYFGLDVNPTLLAAGYDVELRAAGLQDRLPRVNLLENGAFETWRFGVTFDLALAHSLFTHLSDSEIRHCLSSVWPSVRPGGRLFATFFPAPGGDPVAEVVQSPGGIRTFLDHDPYHYREEQIRCWADGLPWETEIIGSWSHPRGQHLLRLARTPTGTEAGEG